MDCPCRRRHSRGFVIQTLVHMTPLYPVFCILSLMSWMSVLVCVCARILFNWGAGIRWRMELWLIFVQFKINCVQLLPRQPLPSHTHTNPATFSAIYNPIDECLRSGYRGCQQEPSWDCRGLAWMIQVRGPITIPIPNPIPIWIPIPRLTARSADGWHRRWVPYVRLTRLSHQEQNRTEPQSSRRTLRGTWGHWVLDTGYWALGLRMSDEVAGAEHWLGVQPPTHTTCCRRALFLFNRSTLGAAFAALRSPGWTERHGWIQLPAERFRASGSARQQWPRIVGWSRTHVHPKFLGFPAAFPAAWGNGRGASFRSFCCCFASWLPWVHAFPKFRFSCCAASATPTHGAFPRNLRGAFPEGGAYVS